MLTLIKTLIKEKCPAFIPLIVKIRRLRYKLTPMETKFSRIYLKRGFGGEESVSGPGSDLGQTSVIRRELPILLNEIGTRSLLDAACGDFNWMKAIELNIDRYVGVDIVEELISQNNRLYRDEKREFMSMNIAKDPLPTVDVIMCRDCLIHLSFLKIFSVIKNFKESGSKYLLASTYTKVVHNKDIVTGQWRPLNLQMPPFNFPYPRYIINENCSENEGKYSDKSLGLWPLGEINV